MPWDASANAAFTTGEPWLPIGTENHALNVAAQQADPTSMLSLYRALLALRRAEPALSMGSYLPVAATETVLAYERRLGSRRLVVALNLANSRQRLRGVPGRKRLLLSSGLDRSDDLGTDHVDLRPNEGVILELS
jgi:alpha-glucosidase